MKNLFCLLIAATTATTAIAHVQINLENVPNSKKIFVASLVDGKRIYAKNAGNFAIVPDSALKAYPDHSLFTVGVDSGTTLQYCSTLGNYSQQFLFNYKTVTSNVIHLAYDKEQGKSSVPVCYNISS